MEFLKKPEQADSLSIAYKETHALPSPLEAKRDMLDHPHLAKQAAKSIHDYFYRVTGEMQPPFLSNERKGDREDTIVPV